MAGDAPALDSTTSATTWMGAEPPALGIPPPAAQLRGAFRLAAFLGMTAVLLVPFLAGRQLRHWFGDGVAFHFGAARLWSRISLWLCGLRPEVHGAPVASGALVANHSSWIDILAIRHVGLVYFVAKADVAGWPGIGMIARITGTVFIERRRSEAKRQEALLRERIAHDQRLCFFPEGTSTDGLRVLPFKSSLFSAFFEGQGAEMAVQPVTVTYLPAPESGLPPEFYGWWGTMPLGAHLWQVLCRSRGGTARVVFHPPVRAADFGDRKALAEQTHRAVRGMLPDR